MTTKRTMMPDPRRDFRGLSTPYLERLATEGWLVAAVGMIVMVHAAAAAAWLAPGAWAALALAVALLGARLTYAGARQAVRAGEARERRMP